MPVNIETMYKKYLNQKVIAKKSGWTGTVIKLNSKNRSSPLRVKWHKTQTESNESTMSVKLAI